MDVLEQYLSGGKATAAPPPSNIVNNPGNLRPMGASTGFQKFATPEEGISAADKNLKAYGEKGINTLRGVISRWAPPSENDTNTYIDTVAKRIGLDPDQKIDLSDPVQRHVISGAMFTVEKGSKNLFKPGQQAAATQTTQPVSSDPLENFFAGKKPALIIAAISLSGTDHASCKRLRRTDGRSGSAARISSIHCALGTTGTRSGSGKYR